MSEDANARALARLLEASQPIMDVLGVLRDEDERLHLGAGAVRSAVWDALQGVATPTPVADLDVVYFDAARASPQDDAEIDRRLALRRPALAWQTRNQARMRASIGAQTLREAIALWPETCTAIAVRRRGDDALDILAPWGCDDLLGMIVRPTPTFDSRLRVVAARIHEKRWLDRWPRLRLRPAALARSVEDAALGDSQSAISSDGRLGR